MNFRSILELDARLSDRLRVAEQPGLLRTLAVFFALQRYFVRGMLAGSVKG